MTLNDLIFSKKSPKKYWRHLVFWISQYIFWAFWATSFFCSFGQGYFSFHLAGHSYFILDIAYTYFIAYYLLPRFPGRKKNPKFYISLFLLTVFIYILFMAFQFYRKNLFHASTDEQLLNSWFITMNFITSGPPISCALFLTFKMLKNYYLKIEEKLALTKENANAELQLLKAQVHPHFLFNTLNNIYSFTLIKSQEAGTLVQKLSDTINYMINDCEARMVPLEKELEMLLNYATLEKVRYGDRLEMDIEINGNYHNKLVTPLLMIPFVENSFKHGTSQTLERPWIKLIICVEDNILHFDISNSKPVQSISPNLKNGIGLKNVQKRLQLLYHENHELKISSSSNTFSVRLKIPLEEPKLGETNTINQKEIFSEHQISIYG
jgi:hypothetical protein